MPSESFLAEVQTSGEGTTLTQVWQKSHEHEVVGRLRGRLGWGEAAGKFLSAAE